jgi:plastocyanin
MNGLNSRRIFCIDVSLVLAMTVAIITITDIPALGQQVQNSVSTQTTLMSHGNITSGVANMTQNNTAIINVVNVSIVPDAAGLEDKAYQPNPVEIKAGQSIIWTNNDLTTHTVTEGNPSTNVPANGFDSGLLSPEQTFKHTFNKAGTIEYHCILHPTMIGKVRVS